MKIIASKPRSTSARLANFSLPGLTTYDSRLTTIVYRPQRLNRKRYPRSFFWYPEQADIVLVAVYIRPAAEGGVHAAVEDAGCGKE